MRVSRLGNDEPPDNPVPRRSCRITRENDDSRSKRSANASSSNMISTLPQLSSSNARSTGPSPIVRYAMLTPSSLVAYWISGDSVTRRP